MSNPFDQFDPPNAGGAPPATSPVAGPAAAASPDQPSFTQRMLAALSRTGQTADDQVRLAINGLTLGKFDQMLGPAEVAKTDAARARTNTIIAHAAEAGGYMMGRALLPETAGILPASAEGAIASGVQATGPGKTPQDVANAMKWGGLFGSATQPLAKLGSSIGSKISGMLPESLGGLPDTPTSAAMLDPRKLGGYSFISGADKATAGKLANLENMEYNTANTGSSLAAQVHSLLNKNVDSGMSQADALGFSDAEQAALAKVGKTTPVSTAFQRHPRIMMQAVQPITEAPEVALGVRGEMGSGIGLGTIGAAADIGTYFGTGYLARRGEQTALDAAKRTIAGQPTSTPTQDWFKDSGTTALHRLLLGSYLNAGQGNQVSQSNPFDQFQ